MQHDCKRHAACISCDGWDPASCRQCAALFIAARSKDLNKTRPARKNIFRLASSLNRPFQQLFAKVDSEEAFSDAWLKDRFMTLEAKRLRRSGTSTAALSDLSYVSETSLASPNPRDFMEATYSTASSTAQNVHNNSNLANLFGTSSSAQDSFRGFPNTEGQVVNESIPEVDLESVMSSLFENVTAVGSASAAAPTATTAEPPATQTQVSPSLRSNQQPNATPGHPQAEAQISTVRSDTARTKRHSSKHPKRRSSSQKSKKRSRYSSSSSESSSSANSVVEGRSRSRKHKKRAKASRHVHKHRRHHRRSPSSSSVSSSSSETKSPERTSHRSRRQLMLPPSTIQRQEDVASGPSSSQPKASRQQVLQSSSVPRQQSSETQAPRREEEEEGEWIDEETIYDQEGAHDGEDLGSLGKTLLNKGVRFLEIDGEGTLRPVLRVFTEDEEKGSEVARGCDDQDLNEDQDRPIPGADYYIPGKETVFRETEVVDPALGSVPISLSCSPQARWPDADTFQNPF